MLVLSELLIGNYQLETFDQLLELIKQHAQNGEMFIQMDVRPPFPDTPDDWEQKLETTFTSANNLR